MIHKVKNKIEYIIKEKFPYLKPFFAKLYFFYRWFRDTIKACLEVIYSCISFGNRLLIFVGLKKDHKHVLEYKKILIAGGYGYGNIGDEAQLAANLEHWKNIVPDCTLTVLTPDKGLTEKFHNVLHAELAPRVAFFNYDRCPNYGRSNLRFKIHFFILAPILLINARLSRAGLPVFFISARAARLLDVIYNSDLLFLSGGGYLTGHTLSRLWDNMLLIRLAYILGVPTILSGQNIGVWEKDIVSQWFAKWGFKKAKLISVRDPEDSLRDLKTIGIDGDHVQATFDDALYCRDVPKEEVYDILRNNSIDPEKPYIIVSVQGGGIINEHLAKFFDFVISNCNTQVAFIQMYPHDDGAARSIINLMKTPAHLIEYVGNIEKTIAIIRYSEVCIAMKHHPIIFAMGNGVPVISIADSEYYNHKNKGALSIFGLEEFSIYCEPDKLHETLLPKFEMLWKERDKISDDIKQRYDELKPMAAAVIKRWIKENDVYYGLKEFKDIHKGQRCFIIGTGPSLNKTNLSLLKDEIVIGVNTLYNGLSKFGINCKYYCVSDVVVWRNHYRKILDLDAVLFLSGEAGEDYIAKRAYYSNYRKDRIYVIKRKDDSQYLTSISKNITQGAYWGGTVIIDVCLQLTYYMGFKNNYLLGCDCDYSGMHRFDGAMTDELRGPGVMGEWEGIFKSYEICKRTFEDAGHKIVNCTVGGKLEVFEREKLEDVI